MGAETSSSPAQASTACRSLDIRRLQLLQSAADAHAWGTGREGSSSGIWKRGSIEGKKRRSFDKAGVSEVPLRDEGGRRALEGLYEMEGEKGDEVAMCTEEEEEKQEEDGRHE